MHIPDGILSARVSLATSVLSLLCLAGSLRKLKKGMGDKAIPLLGVTSAFVFAAQMVNFPIPGGASGHLLGASLCAIVLGPALGILSLSMVLVVQCFLLHDGGITALGANILNMSLAGIGVAWLAFSLTTRFIHGRKGLHIGVVLSSWLAVVFSAFLTSLELGLSGAAPMKVVIPAMVGIHSIIGIGEAIITDLIVVFIYEVDVDILIGFTASKKP